MKGLDIRSNNQKASDKIVYRENWKSCQVYYREEIKDLISQAVQEALAQKELVCSFCQKEIKGNAKNWGFMSKGTELDVNYHGKCKDAYDKIVVQEVLAKQRDDINQHLIEFPMYSKLANPDLIKRSDFSAYLQDLLKDSTKEER